jgi:hypothetical protein
VIRGALFIGRGVKGIWISLSVELEALFELFLGVVDGFNGFDAVAAEIVGGVFEMFFGMAEGFHGGADFRVGFG